MTESGGWGGGGWSPDRRQDEQGRSGEPPRDDAAQDAPRADGGASGGTDADRYGNPGYGAPTWGGADQPTQQQPSYGQPSYGQPTEQQRYDQPTQGQPTYGAPDQPPRYDQPTQQQPTYGAPDQPPRYDQPTQQQPTYGGGGGYGYGGPDPQTNQNQPNQGQSNQGQPYGQYGAPGPGGYGNPYAPPSAAPKKRSGAKLGLIIGLVVVLVAGLGVGAWALFLRGGPAVTWQGKEVKDPEAVLTSAQGELDTLVSDQKGAKAEDTRCYFAVPQNPPKDTPETDVTDTVYCGPALFVDGDTAKPYIPYGITASGGDQITLTVGSKGSPDGATSVPSGQKLVRPDGASAPDGAGGLKVPEPPPAEENVFTAVDDLDVSDAPEGARMAGLTGGVQIEKLGEVDRYGSGSDARSAPDGQKLIAFQLGEASGDGSSNGPSVLGLKVVVDGGTPEDLPDPDKINVIAVPSDAKTVDLVATTDGPSQTLSLLDGKPGAGNIAVLARTNRLGSFTAPGTFNFTETGGGASADRPCTLTGSVAGLFYWVDDKGSAAASATTNAILETDLKYTFSTDSPPPFTGSSAGDTATFEPSHLSITLPDGQVIPAKVLSDRTVFEVPATFTEGTITVGGAFTNANAITFTVAAPVSFKVSIPTS